MAKEVERVQVIARLPLALVKRAKHHAVETRQSFQAVLGLALEAYLQKGGK